MINYKNHNHKIALIAGLSILGAIVLPDSAFAQSALFDSGTNFLTALQDLLTNTWARIIGIISICIAGILAMAGRLRWGVAGSIVGGLILVFGSAAIVDSVAANI